MDRAPVSPNYSAVHNSDTQCCQIVDVVALDRVEAILQISTPQRTLDFEDRRVHENRTHGHLSEFREILPGTAELLQSGRKDFRHEVVCIGRACDNIVESAAKVLISP